MAAQITVIKGGGNEEEVRFQVRFKATWTCAKAEKKIRESFLLLGGRLEDENGIAVGDEEDLEARNLSFVGGISTGKVTYSHSHLSI